MKILLEIVSLFVILYSDASEQITLINHINSNSSSTWTAVEYPESLIQKMRKMVMHRSFVSNNEFVKSNFVSLAAVPDTFDAREKWSSWILPVRDQMECGSCYAFAVAEATGDRVQIATNKYYGPFSPQEIVSCLGRDCIGGDIDKAWTYVLENGLALDSCIPYTSQHLDIESCPSTCVNGSEIIKLYAKSFTYLDARDFQEDIFNFGPLPVQFRVYDDFLSYGSGVYQHVAGNEVGWHAVLLMGWGTENSLPYWLVQNSWGDQWGISGYFKIRRGTNECAIEKYSSAGYF